MSLKLDLFDSSKLQIHKQPQAHFNPFAFPNLLSVYMKDDLSDQSINFNTV